MHPPPEHRDPRRGPSRGTWVLIGFAAVAAYFLLTEHRAHAVEFLPFGLLLACLLMHVFHGHGGHGGHRTHGDPAGPPTSGPQRHREGEHR